MKNRKIVVLWKGLLATLGGIMCFFISCSVIPLKGNGKIITIEKPMPTFEEIKITGTGKINYHKSQEYRMLVSVDSNLEEYVNIFTKNKVLHIETKTRRPCLFTQFTIDVYCPSLSSVSISGLAAFNGNDKINTQSFILIISGSGKINGTFECADFSIQISGSGEVNGTVLCSNFSANISGSGKIDINGNSNDMNMKVSGYGVFNGRDFETQKSDVNISGSGKISLWVLEYLKVNNSGAGRITYRGNPKIEFKNSGLGRIENE
jgi:hypothetical protein